MASEFGESASLTPSSPSCFGNNNNNNNNSSSNVGDPGNFECNICFDLAQDPIITRCGHLFCWPCLYKWLHLHSTSQECPVCKALVEEEKLVPLYGRGKNSSDPRSKSFPGMDIPHRPTGQRPDTAPTPPPDATAFGGFAPVAHARYGNFTLSAVFGGLIPSFFNGHTNGFPDAAMYGLDGGFPYGYTNMFHGGAHGFSHRISQQQQADSSLKLILLVIAAFVLLVLIWN